MRRLRFEEIGGYRMKYFIWKMVYKIILKWEKVAFKNGLNEQVNECIQIQNRLQHYKSVMIDKGIWK